MIESGDLSGALGRSVVLSNVAGVTASRVAVVGLGKASAFGATQFRRALAAAVKSISSTKSHQILNCLTLETNAADAYYLGRATAEAIGDELYRFTQMKSGRNPASMPLMTQSVARFDALIYLTVGDSIG